jgi:hypothetical protein
VKPLCFELLVRHCAIAIWGALQRPLHREEVG